VSATGPEAGDAARRAELAANLVDLEARVLAACAAAGRDRSEVSVIAVTKTFPADDVRLLAGLGVTDVGENRDQEAAPKHLACEDLPLRWHFVGRLQRNKCRSVVTYADVIHSVDRGELVTALSAAAAAAGRRVEVLLQVSLDATGAVGRSGAAPEDISGLAARVESAPDLVLRGVMAVAPLGGDPDAAFDRLAVVSADLRSQQPAATVISAGMSGDLEAAVRHGATHLRVGSALLGARSSPVR
jgi:PLP dependent protein